MLKSTYHYLRYTLIIFTFYKVSQWKYPDFARSGNWPTDIRWRPSQIRYA